MLASLIIGVHLLSAHVPNEDGMKNTNPGIYFRTEDGITGGIYKNTLGRTSAYAGYTFTSGPVSLTVGAVSGYSIERRERPCNDRRANVKNEGSRCYQEEGGSRNRLAPMIAPSINGPDFAGISPRLTYLPKLGANRYNVLHLSLEANF